MRLSDHQCIICVSFGIQPSRDRMYYAFLPTYTKVFGTAIKMCVADKASVYIENIAYNRRSMTQFPHRVPLVRHSPSTNTHTLTTTTTIFNHNAICFFLSILHGGGGGWCHNREKNKHNQFEFKVNNLMGFTNSAENAH